MIPPGTWAFEVAADQGDLRCGDIIFEIDGAPVRGRAPAATRDVAARGGAAARLVRNGAVLDALLPPGLRGRVTAAPTPLSPTTCVGTTPLADLHIEPGSYLVVVRRAGFEDVRRPFVCTRSKSVEIHVELSPDGTTAPGFVRVETAGYAPFWMMEREVTAAEYLEFLNDPHTLREIDGAGGPVRAPRGLAALACGSPWPRGQDGRYSIASDWRPDWPVFGVSLEDARAFGAWATVRARAQGRTEIFDLPTHDEWVTAGHGAGDRIYPYGNRYRPRWAKGCFAKPRAFPEPVLSYPVDESPAGVFDLSGSVFEWCDSWYDEGRRLYRLAGGSWARGFPYEMKIWTPRGEAADFASGETGFRLVARRPGAAK